MQAGSAISDGIKPRTSERKVSQRLYGFGWQKCCLELMMETREAVASQCRRRHTFSGFSIRF